MIYERRTYTCMPGKMPEVLDRFETHVLPLWQEHGYRQIGFWTELIGDDSRRLHYILSWNGLAERETKTKAFAGDPRWLRVRQDTEKGGPLVERVSTAILTPTVFSALQ